MYVADVSNLAIVPDGVNKDDLLSTLELVTKPIPKASPGQVVVHITLRPINPSDFITIRTGRAGAKGTPGSEGFGIVHEVGEGVTAIHKGQRVIPICEPQKGNGSFQKYISIDARFALPVPDDLPDEAAAQFAVNPLTAYFLLKNLQMPKGEYMLQSAAGSTVGKQLISLARHWGIKTINVVRRSAQKADLKTLGADEVLCSSDEDVAAGVKTITAGKGAWGASDAVCGALTAVLASCVRDGGQVIVYGVLGGFSATLGAGDLIRGVSVTGWSLYRTGLGSDPAKTHALAAEVAPLVSDAIIPVAEVEKFDLSDFKQALATAEQPARSGKVFLVSL